jgi:cytochrome b561
MTPTYDPVARIFHWLTVALILLQLVAGWLMPDIHNDMPETGWIGWHFSVGPFLLLVMLLRLLWRLTHPVAPPPLERWEYLLSRATHGVLYALVLVMCVLGWIAANAHGFDEYLLGIKLPALAPSHAEWGHKAGDVHGALVWVLLGLIALHIAGALYHRLVRRDAVLARMLPGV